MSPRKPCAWCNGTGTYKLGNHEPRTRPCDHPGPVTIRALPGAEFRTTKYEMANSERRLMKIHAYKPPAGGLYAAFRKAVEATGDKLTVRMSDQLRPKRRAA